MTGPQTQKKNQNFLPNIIRAAAENQQTVVVSKITPLHFTIIKWNDVLLVEKRVHSKEQQTIVPRQQWSCCYLTLNLLHYKINCMPTQLLLSTTKQVREMQ